MLKRNVVRIKLININYVYERYRSTIIDVDVVYRKIGRVLTSVQQ